jgi:hypothetical protein
MEAPPKSNGEQDILTAGVKVRFGRAFVLVGVTGIEPVTSAV